MFQVTSCGEFWTRILKSPHIGHSCFCSFMVGMEAVVLAVNIHLHFGKWKSEDGCQRSRAMYYSFCREYFLVWKQQGSPSWGGSSLGLGMPVICVPGAGTGLQAWCRCLRHRAAQCSDSCFLCQKGLTFSFKICLKYQKLKLVLKHFKLTAGFASLLYFS